ncbi:MAG: hypothetical protein ACI4WG_01160 [Erysipelotrichaceae bacterium]
MRKKVTKIIVGIIVVMLAVVVITAMRKPVGGISGLFSTINFSEEMSVESTQTTNNSAVSKVTLKIKGYNLFESGKFKGEIVIDNQKIVNGDEFSLLANHKDGQYTITVVQLPKVADNGIDLIPTNKTYTFSIFNNEAYLIIVDDDLVSSYYKNLGE